MYWRPLSSIRGLAVFEGIPMTTTDGNDPSAKSQYCFAYLLSAPKLCEQRMRTQVLAMRFWDTLHCSYSMDSCSGELIAPERRTQRYRPALLPEFPESPIWLN